MPTLQNATEFIQYLLLLFSYIMFNFLEWDGNVACSNVVQMRHELGSVTFQVFFEINFALK